VLKLGLDVGAFTNPDKASGEMQVYALPGMVYSPTGDVDLSLGFKFGVTRPEQDFAGTAGLTSGSSPILSVLEGAPTARSGFATVVLSCAGVPFP